MIPIFNLFKRQVGVCGSNMYLSCSIYKVQSRAMKNARIIIDEISKAVKI